MGSIVHRSHKNTFPSLIFPLLLIIAGGMIYIFFRPSEPSFFKWFEFGGFESQLAMLRQKTLNFGLLLPPWIVFSLPNGLWAFAYSWLILEIWKYSRSKIRYFWYATIPVLIFGCEFLQHAGKLPGTFCWQDMISGALGILSGTFPVYGRRVLNNIKSKKKSKYKLKTVRLIRKQWILKF
jgi:hypothetical protein